MADAGNCRRAATEWPVSCIRRIHVRFARIFRSIPSALIQGRLFDDRDNAGSPNVVIVNEALARQLWPRSNPLHDHVLIGKGMGPKFDHDTPREIVGVVGDIRDRGLNRAARPAVYIPIAQLPSPTAAATLELLPVAWFVRAPAGPRALSSSIQATLQ